MKRVLIWVLSLWSVVGIGWSRSEDGLQELKAKDRLLSFLEKDAVSPGANSLMIPLTLIQGAASKGAVCLDGTAPGYHLDRGFGSGSNSWLIQLEGGGWCNTVRSCVFHKTTRRGSSKFMEKRLNFTGILSNKAEENPDFYNWNRVKLRYCDGASFAGEGQNEANQLYFRGQRIWSSAMEELMAKGMQNAEQALLSGCSAGGLASILHCDEFKDLFPSTTKVKCLSDAGVFLDATNVAGGHTLRDMYRGVVTLQGVQKNLPNTCTSQMDPTSCFFPQNLIANIQTPLFLLNAAYDAWQVQESLIPSSADPHGFWRDCKMDHSHCNSSQMLFLQDFRNQMLSAINGFSMSNQNGLFINSCFAHCQSERQDTWYANDSPRIGNKAIAASVGDWFLDRTATKAIDCPYPCDNTCHNLIFNDVTSTITISESTRLTPASPLRSPRYRHGRKPGRFSPFQPGRTVAHHVAWLLLSALLRRQGIFLFAPLIYISGMLLYMGTVSFDVVPLVKHRPAPGSVYRSPQVYEKLKIEMNEDYSSADAILTIWKNSYKGGEWRPCVNKPSEGLPESNGYIYVEANGGLNQQRTSICNAVAVAGYLNATLLIPNFHFHSIWRDPSKFKDIYDEDYFISALENNVQVVDKIPEYIMERFDHNLTNVYNFKIKAWSSIQYYRDEVLPKLLEEKIIRISPFANRLSFDAPPAVQRLRCLANYEALRFSSTILSLGETLVARMKKLSANTGGKYVSVHLRFEEDMVAFSCCVFDGGEQEKEDMKNARERGWKGKFTKPGRVIRPGAIRINGKCPLTPLEVGLMLRGMGFGNNTYIFLASGKIYNAEKTMAPLLDMFPNLQTKEMLASEEELAPYKNFSSRMAAIDYTVCLHSEVFVTTQGGNFPHFLMGHRRYLFGGHSKTIRPDKRKLALLFDNPNIGWKSFKRQMLNMRSHSDSKGFELKKPVDSIYTFPCPDCMCRTNKSANSGSSSAT